MALFIKKGTINFKQHQMDKLDKTEFNQAENRVYKKFLEKLILNEWNRSGELKISHLQLLSMTEHFDLNKEFGRKLLSKLEMSCSNDKQKKVHTN